MAASKPMSRIEAKRKVTIQASAAVTTKFPVRRVIHYTPKGLRRFKDPKRSAHHWVGGAERRSVGRDARGPSKRRRASIKLIALVRNCIEEERIGCE